jgi:hypothetical protein
MLIKGDEGSAQIIHNWHGTKLHKFALAAPMVHHLAA